MEVKVYAPMGPSNLVGVKEDNNLELPEDATLADVYGVLTTPDSLSELFICTINNRKTERMNTPLRDGDTVRFTFPYAGG